MNKYWGKTLQETVGKTVTGLSDSATRLKQNWDKPQTSPEPSSQSSSPRQLQVASPDKDKDKQQYLRLPIESARKLRWYDREDLSNLVEANLKDKRLLQATVAALRQVVQDSGLSEAAFDDELRERIEEVDNQALYDEGVASVLLASLQSEAAAMRAKLESQATQLAELEQRLSNAPQQAPDAAGDDAGQSVVLQIVVTEAAPEAGQGQTRSALDSRCSDLALKHATEASNSEAQRLRGDTSDAAKPPLPVSTHSWGDALPSHSRQDENSQAMAALLGKLGRVEEERREYFEEMARLNDLLSTHERSAAELRETLGHLQVELDTAKKGQADAEASAEARLQDLRSRVSASQLQHAEMLRRAQDICIESEERSTSLQKKLDKADARAAKAEADLKEAGSEARRLASDLKAREREKEKLEARTAAAEAQLAEAKQKGELERGGALSSALAAARKGAEEREGELRKAMREGEAKLREKIDRLEADNAEVRRSLARAEAELSALEARVADAEETEGALHRDLRAAEAAAADRDELEARMTALQECLEETRAEQSQLSHYKKIAKDLEVERTKVEEEVVATVRIATSLEARLQAANSFRANAEHMASLAEKRAAEAERKVEREVARRLELIGADESQWPQAARETLERRSKKLEGMHAVLAGLQNELEAEQHNLAAEQAARHSLQGKLSAADEKLARLEREAKEAVQKLERKISAAQAEASEWQREAAAAEAELSRLTSSRKPAMYRTLSTGSHASTPRRGGGTLKGVLDESEMTNGNGGPIDHLYLKNVLLKFIVAATQGRLEQCQVLLPAVATLLHASPQEYKALKGVVSGQSSWWPQAAAQ